MTKREKMFINQCATVSEPMPPFGPTVTNTVFNFQSVHMSDITKIIHLPEKHSSGPDGISYIMLKFSLPAIVGTLVRLFNISLRLGEVPEEWKDAVVIPLQKGGKKASKDPLSCRPSPWPPAWPGFVSKPSTCKSESISRWTNSFMIISLVFYRSTPQLPNCAT